MNERRSYIDRSSSLSLCHQADLLKIHRSSLYFKPLGESAKNLELMRIMDELFADDPTLGVIGMQDELYERGMAYNIKRIRRLLRKMSVEPISPKQNLSRLFQRSYVHPYLLRA